MHLKYLHYFGNESSESLLEAYGIVTRDHNQPNVLKYKQCPNCSEPGLLRKISSDYMIVSGDTSLLVLV